MPEPVKMSVTRDQVEQWKAALVIPEACRPRMSAYLTGQLVMSPESWLAVVKAICAMEAGQQTTMKSDEPFRRRPLKGLRHTHFWTHNSLFKNIMAGWNQEHDWVGLDKRIADFWKRHDGEEFTEQLINEFAYFMINGPIDERSSRCNLTGEWIVYAKRPEGNVYLALAKHTASLDEDRRLAALIRKNCGWEFPFLLERDDSFGSFGA